MDNESIKRFAEEYSNKAEFIKDLMKPPQVINIPPDPKIELARKQVELTKELVENAKNSDIRSKRAEINSWVAIVIGVAGVAISAFALFKG